MNKLEKINRLSKQAVDMLIYNRKSHKYKNLDKYKDMWLISERGVEAKDNGYAFFKYLRENHPEINAHYVIDSSCVEDYKRVKVLGNIIEYGSLEHKIAFLLCKYAISSHSGYLEPWSYKLYKLLIDRKNEKFFVFLQHGIILSDLSEYVNGKMYIDLFITTTKREYKSLIQENYGFKDGVVARTGLARYDNLSDFNLKRQILLMPTWRKNIINPSYTKVGNDDQSLFVESAYFKTLNSLINNKRFIELLEENDIELIFYPHFEMQPYKGNFKINSNNIIMADKDEYSVQELLKSSMMMITDYSSVAFDFAYMKKPLIYYQKIKDDKYIEGYFDYSKDGFGPQIFDENTVVSQVEKNIKNEFKMEDKYLERVDKCFDIRDTNNCQRIYEKILELKK